MEPEALVTLRAFAFCPSIIHPASLFCQGVAWKWLVCEKVVISVSTRYEGLFFRFPRVFGRKMAAQLPAFRNSANIPTELQRNGARSRGKARRFQNAAQRKAWSSRSDRHVLRAKRSAPIVFRLRISIKMMQKRPAAAPKSSKAGPVLREYGRRGTRRRNTEKLTEGAAPKPELCSSPRGSLFLRPERVLLSCRVLLCPRALRGAVRRSGPSPARGGGSPRSDPEPLGIGIQTGGRFFRRPFPPAVLASPEIA